MRLGYGFAAQPGRRPTRVTVRSEGAAAATACGLFRPGNKAATWTSVTWA